MTDINKIKNTYHNYFQEIDVNNDSILSQTECQNKQSILPFGSKHVPEEGLCLDKYYELINQDQLIYTDEEIKWANYEEVKATCLENPFEFKNAADILRENKTLVTELIEEYEGYNLFPIIESAGDIVTSDRELMLKAAAKDCWVLPFIDDELLDDKEIVLKAVEQDGWFIRFAGTSVIEDREVALAAVKTNGYAMEFLPEEFRREKEFTYWAVHSDVASIEHSLYNWQNDRDIFLLFAGKCEYDEERFLPLFDERFFSDKELALEIVKDNGLFLDRLSDSLKRDKDIVSAACQRNGRAIQYADKSLREDKEFLLEIEISSQFWFNNDFLLDRDFLKQLIEKDPRSYTKALEVNSEYSEDRELALLASKSGIMYEYIPEEYLQDEEILKYLIGTSLRDITESTRYDGGSKARNLSKLLEIVDSLGVIISLTSDIPQIYQRLPARVKADSQVILNCIEYVPVETIPEELFLDHDYIEQLVIAYPSIILRLDENIFDDDLWQLAISEEPRLLDYFEDVAEYTDFFIKTFSSDAYLDRENREASLRAFWRNRDLRSNLLDEYDRRMNIDHDYTLAISYLDFRYQDIDTELFKDETFLKRLWQIDAHKAAEISADYLEEDMALALFSNSWIDYDALPDRYAEDLTFVGKLIINNPNYYEELSVEKKNIPDYLEAYMSTGSRESFLEDMSDSETYLMYYLLGGDSRNLKYKKNHYSFLSYEQVYDLILDYPYIIKVAPDHILFNEENLHYLLNHNSRIRDYFDTSLNDFAERIPIRSSWYGRRRCMSKFEDIFLTLSENPNKDYSLFDDYFSYYDYLAEESIARNLVFPESAGNDKNLMYLEFGRIHHGDLADFAYNGYDIFYARCNTQQEFLNSFQVLSAKAPIDMVVVHGHGSPDGISISGDQDFVFLKDDEFFSPMDFGTIKSLGLNDLISPGSKIFYNSCSTAEGGYYGESFARESTEIFPDHTIYAAAHPTSYDRTRLYFDDNGYFIGFDYKWEGLFSASIYNKKQMDRKSQWQDAFIRADLNNDCSLSSYEVNRIQDYQLREMLYYDFLSAPRISLSRYYESLNDYFGESFYSNHEINLSDKDYVIEHIGEDQMINPYLINDPEVVQALFDEYRSVGDFLLKKISYRTLVSNDVFLKQCLAHDPYFWFRLGDDYKYREDIIEHALANSEDYPRMFEELPDDYKTDEDRVRRYLELNPFIIIYLPLDFPRYRKLALRAVELKHESYSFVDEKFRSDMWFALKALSLNPEIGDRLLREFPDNWFVAWRVARSKK